MATVLATAKQWETALNRFDVHEVNVLTQGNCKRKLKEAYAVDGFHRCIQMMR